MQLRTIVTRVAVISASVLRITCLTSIPAQADWASTGSKQNQSGLRRRLLLRRRWLAQACNCQTGPAR